MKLKSVLLVAASFAFSSNYTHATLDSILCKDLYLDLMKKCLINSIYQDSGFGGSPYNHVKRETGRDWPSIAHTMIGKKRLDNIQFCVEYVLQNNVPGDLIETGVWRGGAVIFMRAILKAYSNVDRTVWVADSFQGLPVPNTSLYPADAGIDLYKYPYLSVSLEAVKTNFQQYGLLDDQVRFLKGWFRDTLPHAPIEKIAVLRLDGDLYESTMDSLNSLYPKLSVGGFVIIDDYSLIRACRSAVDEFRNKNNITDEIKDIDGIGVFWQRSK